MDFFVWLNQKPARGAWISLLLGAVIFILNWRLLERFGAFFRPEWIWFFTLLILVLALAVIGGSVNGRPDGVLIDNRNRVSLSKFQVTLWTLIVLSAVASAAAYKAIAQGAVTALDINIPEHLLLAMGISGASFAGTPLILKSKAEESGSDEALRRTAEKLSTDLSSIWPTGRVFGRTNAAAASWADMFRGDETSNAATPDLGKIQQFFISIGLIMMYAAMLWAQFANGTILAEFPQLSAEFVGLMGISHATYLAYKAAPHGGAPDASSVRSDPNIQAVG